MLKVYRRYFWQIFSAIRIIQTCNRRGYFARISLTTRISNTSSPRFSLKLAALQLLLCIAKKSPSRIKSNLQEVPFSNWSKSERFSHKPCQSGKRWYEIREASENFKYCKRFLQRPKYVDLSIIQPCQKGFKVYRAPVPLRVWQMCVHNEQFYQNVLSCFSGESSSCSRILYLAGRGESYLIN
jgi:hypothetical protein